MTHPFGPSLSTMGRQGGDEKGGSDARQYYYHTLYTIIGHDVKVVIPAKRMPDLNMVQAGISIAN
jgi:hypothetical protein